MTPHEELQAALAQRTYEDGLLDGELKTLMRTAAGLHEIARVVQAALHDIDTTIEQLRARP